jgi:hypothetical protein
MQLEHPKQAPYGEHKKQNDLDYAFVKRWRLTHNEQFNVTFWMRGEPNRIALIVPPWEPDTSANILLMVRLTCIAEKFRNVSVLSEAWGLPEGQPQLEGVPIRDHAKKTEIVTAAYYWAEDGQLWQRSRAGLLVRNTKGRVIRIAEIKGKDGKGNREPVVCEEGSGCIPDGIRAALVFDWPDAMRAEVKAMLDEMHSHTESLTVH